MNTDKRQVCLMIDSRFPLNRPRVIEFEEWLEQDEDYCVISLAEEIEFQMKPTEEIITLQLQGLDKKRNEAIAVHTQLLKEIDEAKSKLTAITYQPEEGTKENVTG